MPDEVDHDGVLLRTQVERTLEQCLQWTQLGRHRKVLSEVERTLPLAERETSLLAELLLWKAQALLNMSLPERARTAAERSWEMMPSPYSCYLMASAQYACGLEDEAEETFRVGMELFPEAQHLIVHLATVLAEQGRVSEALQLFEELTGDLEEAPDELQVHIIGLHANLLAVAGRWTDAESLLRDGLERFANNELLSEALGSLLEVRRYRAAARRLAGSWEEELAEGRTDELDAAIMNAGLTLGASRLEVLAARRLARAMRASISRPRAVDAWAVALIGVVRELDGQSESASSLARMVRAVPATVRRARSQIRAYLDELEPELVHRSFAAASNVRLDEPSEPGSRREVASVIAFPTRS
jgi:tetratricopeptide (TPR) repeat protein